MPVKRSLKPLLPLAAAILPTSAVQAQATPAPPSGPRGDEAAEIAGQSEIIVTATRQAQPLSRVPISVSAFSQATMDIKGIKSFEDVARFTPGVRFDPDSNDISIRGISSEAGAGTTGIYIDDTPIQIRGLGFRSDNALPAIFDLDRVEVLRGPQGTLFGAGSEGGTVRYITPQPGLTDYSSFARAEVSSTAHGGQSYEAGGAVGGPIVKDVLGFRISAWHRRDAGYVDHVDNATGTIDAKNIDHGDVSVVHGALAYAPLPGLTITPSLHYQRRSDHAADTFVEGVSSPHDGIFRTSSPEYRGDRDRFYLPALHAKYDFGGVSLISDTSYFRRDNHTGYDGTVYDLSYYQSLRLDPNCDPGAAACASPPVLLTPTGTSHLVDFYLSPSRVTNRQRTLTQEVRLQSGNPDARLNWVAGVFYQRSRQLSREELVDPLGDRLFRTVFGISLEQYFGQAAGADGGFLPLYDGDSYINQTRGVDTQFAGFADVTFAVTDRFKVTAGGRYAYTKFSFRNFADGPQNFGRSEGSGRNSEKPFTPRVGVDYQADRDNLFYASWAKGFRVGGANAPVPYDACRNDLQALGLNAAPDSYNSDKVRSIEIGSKNKLFDHKLQLAASVYQIDWKSIQQTVTLSSCAVTFTGNLGKARSRGFDLQATLTPVSGLAIDASLGYTQARYTIATAFGDAIVVARGDAIEGPPWTAAVGAQYDLAVDGRSIYLRGDYEYESRLHRPTAQLDPVTQPYDPALIAPSARSFVSLRAGTVIGPANVSLFVDNLLDSTPRLTRTHSDLATLLFTRTTVRPRTVGLTLTYRQ